MVFSSETTVEAVPLASRPPTILNAPQPLSVQHVSQPDGRRPTAVEWRGRQRRVVRILNVWRVDDEWWRNEVRRQYFELLLEGDVRLTIFEDCLTGHWYHQRA